MAHRGVEGAFGDLAERRQKMDAKYDTQLEADQRAWVASVTGTKVDGDFMEALQDGVVLCKLMNALQPGSIKDIYTGGLPFKKMENISKFLGTCPGYGVRQSDIFQVPDLFEGTNKTAVQVCLDNVRRLSEMKGKGVAVAPQKAAASTFMPKGKVAGPPAGTPKKEEDPTAKHNKYGGGAVNSSSGDGQLFGDMAERKAKIASKFNEAAAKSTMAWIEKTTGESVKDFHEDLKDGIALCKLINALGTTVKYNDSSKLAFKCMERINLFIEGARQAGLRSEELFQTVDLYEAANLTQVLTCLDALHRIAGRN